MGSDEESDRWHGNLGGVLVGSGGDIACNVDGRTKVTWEVYEDPL